MSATVALAILLAVVGSISFAAGATAQHRGVDATVAASGGSDRSMSLKHLLTLARTPVWLLGLGLILTGAVMHIAALRMAPLTVIQPVGILAVPASVLMAARLKRERPARAIWGAVAVTIVGIVGFTVFSTSHATVERDLREASMLSRIGWGVAVLWLLALAFAAVGKWGPRRLRCLGWAWAGAALYGLGSGFIKILTTILVAPDRWQHPLLLPAALGLAAAYGVGGVAIQQAYATGAAEIVVGSMTTVDPLAAVAFGLTVLGEGAGMPWTAGLGMLVTGAIAVGGVVLLSHHHPDVAAPLAPPTREDLPS